MSLGSYTVVYAEKIRRELETLRKKKQHLDGLLDSEKISKPTHEYFAKNLDDEIGERESQQKDFTDTITSKLQELEQNIEKLELYLAEIELKHIVAEIDGDLYERESKILTLGIENAKRELNTARTALFKTLPELTPEDTTTELEEETVEEAVEATSAEAEEPATEETTTEETDKAVEASEEEEKAKEETITETEQQESWEWGRFKLTPPE